jgi:hypothetical protein
MSGQFLFKVPNINSKGSETIFVGQVNRHVYIVIKLQSSEFYTTFHTCTLSHPLFVLTNDTIGKLDIFLHPAKCLIELERST